MQSNLFELQVDQSSMSYLKDAARWARFLAIVGFIFCGLFVLFAILAGTALSGLFNTMGTTSTFAGGIGAGMIAFIYIVIALLNFFPCLYLYNFGTRMKVALRNNDQEQLIVSFKNVRAFFRFVGVLMVIGICFWVLALLITIIGASAARI